MSKSVQAERREKEMQRRHERATTPPLAQVFSTQLVGVSKQDGYPSTLWDLQEMMERPKRQYQTQFLQLVREPDNEFDENAIAVHWNGVKIGHLNRVIAFRMAPELDAGTTWLARVEEVGGDEHIGVSIRCKREE
jgi:hypothetical protein